MMRKRLRPLEEIEPGMELADDMYDATGHVLLGNGAVLTAGMIESLNRRGIAHIPIAERIDAEEAARLRAAARRRVEALFRRAGDDPLMAKLREAVLEYRLEELQ